MKTDGIFKGLTFEEYAKDEAVNASFLCEFDRSPAHGRAYLFGRGRKENTTMKMGTLCHRFALEPATALENLVCRPVVNGVEMDFRGKEGKAWRDAQLAAGNTIITAQERADICGMVASVVSHPVAKRILADGDAEVSMFANWEGKLTRKCRVDFLPSRGNILPDLKTCTDARKHGFARQIAALKYHLKAAYYMDICESLGIEKEIFAFICVESSAPYNVSVYQLDKEDIEAGRTRYEELLRSFVRCLQTDEWPGYSQDIQTISLPAWARKNEEEAA